MLRPRPNPVMPLPPPPPQSRTRPQRLAARVLASGLAAALAWPTSSTAGPIRDALKKHHEARAAASPHPAAPASGIEQDEEDGAQTSPIKLPPGAVLIEDVSYGGDPAQRFDVYRPKGAKRAPVIFMVHGGGWRHGSKAAQGVLQNKVAHWVGKGFVLISTDYRLLPDADPLEQARDVAQALTTAQAQASSWGGDASQFVLMGHSAGAHLVALINASPVIALGLGAKPWLGAVSLDSAALNVVSVMEGKHLRLYDRAFGADPGFWQATSPWHQLTKGSAPLLAVCSTRRQDSCPHAEQYRDKAMGLGSRVSVLHQPLSHGDINERLGLAGAYTAAVDAFLGGLSIDIAYALQGVR
jgi:arylformamidase